jgi:EAL domain-containing protein (putative c-di-GMP-specific phosphodiesterase class I)/AmiR/NasT family two-component response regulator
MPYAEISPMVTDYSTLRVLVVDDQEIARHWVRGVLGTAGIAQITEVNSGRAAVQAVTERGAKFDLILCDLRMPGKDGIETLRTLASLGLQCAVAILSVEDERVIESAGLLAALRGLNFVGAVSKPLNEEKLGPILKRTLEAAKPKPPVQLDLAEGDLEVAFSRGELEMNFQPKIHMHSGECVGAEALIRWMHPQHGLLGADQFVPLAERSPALVKQLTTFALREALTACARWHENGRNIGVSINVSPLACDQLDLPDVIETMAQESNVLPADVTLEVRESTLSGYPAMMVEIGARLRIHGFRLALDDFTGRNSAIEEVIAVPFNEIKLDRSSVDGCTQVPVKRALVEAGLAMARNLKLSSVAVGITQRPDWELLTELGCEFAQGHFIARAMPESGFSIWLARWEMSRQRQ